MKRQRELKSCTGESNTKAQRITNWYPIQSLARTPSEIKYYSLEPLTHFVVVLHRSIHVTVKFGATASHTCTHTHTHTICRQLMPYYNLHIIITKLFHTHSFPWTCTPHKHTPTFRQSITCLMKTYGTELREKHIVFWDDAYEACSADIPQASASLNTFSL